MLTCEFETVVFAVSVKLEVVVSRPEVILRHWKWLSPAQIYSESDDAECKEVSVSTLSPLLVHITGAHAYRERLAFLSDRYK